MYHRLRTLPIKARVALFVLGKSKQIGLSQLVARLWLSVSGWICVRIVVAKTVRDVYGLRSVRTGRDRLKTGEAPTGAWNRRQSDDVESYVTITETS